MGSEPGSKKIDNFLQGGIETRSITELSGEFRSGKSQLCHTLAVSAQLPAGCGGLNGKVAYIDSDGTFRPERITKIAIGFGVRENHLDKILDNISWITGTFGDAPEHQMEILDLIPALFAEAHEEGSAYKLLIVDSATALYRINSEGQGKFTDRQQTLGAFLAKLNQIAEECLSLC